MTHRKPFPAGTESRMRAIMLSATRARELRHAQCIYLAATTDWTYAEIATLTGLRERSVQEIVSRFHLVGDVAVACGDHGHVRRHAALSLEEERSFLSRLATEQEQGTMITAKLGQAVLTDLFGEENPLHRVYDIFQRHGWRCDSLSGQPASEFFPPQVHQSSPQSVKGSISEYTAKSPRISSRPVTLGTMVKLSEVDENVLLDKLKSQLREARAVTIGDARHIVRDTFGLKVSRQTISRILRRRGWQQLRRGGLSMWVPDKSMANDILWNNLVNRLESRLLSTTEETQLLEEFEAAMLSGDPLTVGTLQTAIEKKVGHPVSRAAAAKMLKRNGWRQIVKSGRGFWVTGEPSNLDELWNQLEARPANAILPLDREMAILNQLAQNSTKEESITAKALQEAIQGLTGKQVSLGTAIAMLRRHGWQKFGGSRNTRWARKRD